MCWARSFKRLVFLALLVALFRSPFTPIHSLTHCCAHSSRIGHRYVGHEAREKVLEMETMVREAEERRLEAVRKAEAAEGKLEMFLARHTQH